MARSKITPGAGPSTAMIETPLSAGALGSVRQTTHRTSAPLRSQPVADDTHFLRPLIVQYSAVGVAMVLTPSPGGGDAAFAVFDCLYRDGRDLRREPLTVRRRWFSR